MRAWLVAALLATAGTGAGAGAPPDRLLVRCDGDPPVVDNQDAEAHDVELRCGSKVERRTIPAGAKQVLEGKGGCTIRLGKAKPTKLHAEMVCTIRRGELTCDLL